MGGDRAIGFFEHSPSRLAIAVCVQDEAASPSLAGSRRVMGLVPTLSYPKPSRHTLPAAGWPKQSRCRGRRSRILHMMGAEGRCRLKSYFCGLGIEHGDRLNAPHWRANRETPWRRGKNRALLQKEEKRGGNIVGVCGKSCGEPDARPCARSSELGVCLMRLSQMFLIAPIGPRGTTQRAVPAPGA